MTRKFLITTAAVAMMAGAPVAYAQSSMGTYDAEKRLELQSDMGQAMTAAKGAEVVLSDGTRLGTITDVMSDGSGDANFYVELEDGSVVDADWLDITVSPANVSIDGNVVGLNATKEELATAAAPAGEGEATGGKATIYLQ
ncbi:PRC-barrel domain-containing protein [Sulfitobacter sp. LCG007]